jgi:hypothetical protein
MPDYEWPDLRRVCYGESNTEYGQAVFVPVCPQCSRFVTADPAMRFGEHGITDAPNATCKTHGRVLMPFEGFF